MAASDDHPVLGVRSGDLMRIVQQLDNDQVVPLVDPVQSATGV